MGVMVGQVRMCPEKMERVCLESHWGHTPLSSDPRRHMPGPPPPLIPVLLLLGNLPSMSEVTVSFFTRQSFLRLHVVVG